MFHSEVGGDQNRCKNGVNVGFTFAGRLQSHLQINADVLLCQLDV